MNVLDLFSGIGGFSLGLERAGMRTVAFCEQDEFCRAVLAQHWPGVPIYDDVRTLTADTLRRDGIAVDAICGGFPCQDISQAGNGEGLAGARSGLWFEILRLVGELRPRIVIVENVAALLYRGLGGVLGGLASVGYDAEWHSLGATHAGVPQSRPRVWVIAYPTRSRGAEIFYPHEEHVECYRAWLDATCKYHADADDQSRRKGAVSVLDDIKWTEIPDRERGGGNERLSSGVDRYRAIGNTVVPQIPYLIGKAIMQAEGS